MSHAGAPHPHFQQVSATHPHRHRSSRPARWLLLVRGPASTSGSRCAAVGRAVLGTGQVQGRYRYRVQGSTGWAGVWLPEPQPASLEGFQGSRGQSKVSWVSGCPGPRGLGVSFCQQVGCQQLRRSLIWLQGLAKPDLATGIGEGGMAQQSAVLTRLNALTHSCDPSIARPLPACLPA